MLPDGQASCTLGLLPLIFTCFVALWLCSIHEDSGAKWETVCEQTPPLFTLERMFKKYKLVLMNITQRFTLVWMIHHPRSNWIGTTCSDYPPKIISNSLRRRKKKFIFLISKKKKKSRHLICWLLEILIGHNV